MPLLHCEPRSTYIASFSLHPKKAEAARIYLAIFNLLSFLKNVKEIY
jgi:hypothetical protein